MHNNSNQHEPEQESKEPEQEISAQQGTTRNIVQKPADELEERVEERTAQLTARIMQLENEISERERSSDLTKSLKQEIHLASKAKAEFLAKMSHEIRTPMNGIIGITELLLDTELSFEQREYMHTVRRSGEVLLGIINDIVDFSKIEAGELELELIHFDLRTCLEEVGEMMARRAHEKGLELSVLIHFDIPTRVKGDPGRLRQVLTNLVNNAIKFTETGEVLVRATLADLSEDSETVKLDVIDTGIGIPVDRQEGLFKPFSQINTSSIKKSGRTGLGLAISKQLVEAMGGTIQVESEPGKGSIFSFTVGFERHQGETVSANEPLHTADISGLRVLIVDDHNTNRLVFREQLKTWGCQTEEAKSGSQALSMLKTIKEGEQPFEVALIDFQMTGMDGEELAREITADAEIPDMPLILVTSSPQRGDAAKMLDAGFDAYLTKPVRHSQLHDSIAAVMGGQQESEENKQRPLITQHSLKESSRWRMKLLVVEDNAVNQKIAVKMLEKSGFRCDVAASGREAIQAISKTPYALVFMDCEMPDMDGFDATREIRKLEGESRHTPIVAMTGRVLEGDREQCLEAGMDDYVAKPVSVLTLNEILTKHLTPELTGQAVPAEDTGTRGKPVEMQRIQEIAGGDLDFEHELITDFLSGIVRHFEALAEALMKQDIGSLRCVAHAVKGSSATAGARRMNRLASRLERTVETGELGQVGDILATLKSEFEQVRSYLQGYLSSRESSPENRF